MNDNWFPLAHTINSKMMISGCKIPTFLLADMINFHTATFKNHFQLPSVTADNLLLLQNIIILQANSHVRCILSAIFSIACIAAWGTNFCIKESLLQSLAFRRSCDLHYKCMLYNFEKIATIKLLFTFQCKQIQLHCMVSSLRICIPHQYSE